MVHYIHNLPSNFHQFLEITKSLIRKKHTTSLN